MNDALTTTRPTDINRITAGKVSARHIGRIVIVDHAARIGHLLAVKQGPLRTRITLGSPDGVTTVTVPRGSIVIA